MNHEMTSFFYNDEFSHQLFSAWRELLSENQLPALDRWLKTRNRSYQSKHGQKHGHKQDSSLKQQFGLSAALIEGIRYLQLACALEHAYQKNEAPKNEAPQNEALVGFNEWDSVWSIDEIKKMPVANFWYWIELRTQSAEHKIPRKLRDAELRFHFFNEIKYSLQKIEFSPHFLLWNGLRPSWMPLLQERASLSAWSAEQLLNFITKQNEIPPLWLRAQRGKTVQEVSNELHRAGVIVGTTEAGELFAKGGKGISATDTYKEGYVEIQDLASQQIAAAVDFKSGDKIWDCCAGAGGKSIAIAARMNNKGVLVATDLHAYKLEEIKRRAKRAEISTIRTFEWKGDEPLRLPKEIAQQQGFDWVLVDAPCSAAGTWRRNPDARWRFSVEDSNELQLLQRQILTNAAPAVRAKGCLVYATCSWQVSENEAQVTWFLQEHPEFSLKSQTMLGLPLQNSDTMFVAVLQKNP
jgi:16S rRNA (cytosine967-C5)-methyltransferase